MRQRRNFDAHVLEYAALKIPALPFQVAKCVFCKFDQHQHIASASAPASLRKATPQPPFDGSRKKGRDGRRRHNRHTSRLAKGGVKGNAIVIPHHDPLNANGCSDSWKATSRPNVLNVTLQSFFNYCLQKTYDVNDSPLASLAVGLSLRCN